MSVSWRQIQAFSGKVALVTGAASGIGKYLAEGLAAAGATVHALDVEPIGFEGVHAHQADVSDREGFRRVVDKVVSESGDIDYLFNNAGVTLLGNSPEIEWERWQWLLDINALGVANGVALVYPRMTERGTGHIINTSSIAGATGYASAAAYTMSKGFVNGLTDSLRSEAKPLGVKVTLACPGYVRSNIFTQDRVVGAELSKVVDDFPAPMLEPDEAGRAILEAVAKGKPVVVFPMSAWLLWKMAAWMPGALGFLQRRLMAPFR